MGRLFNKFKPSGFKKKFYKTTGVQYFKMGENEKWGMEFRELRKSLFRYTKMFHTRHNYTLEQRLQISSFWKYSF